ncbi:MAG: hypothetical protein AB8H80_09570 [Planctomycetota bacterium]
MSDGPRGRWLVGGALLLLAAGAIVAVWQLPLDALLRDLSCDDSFYYGAIARELAVSGRSSFDGIVATNGYHPLWCWLQMPVHWLWQDPEAALRATRSLEVCMVCAAALAWLSVLRRGGGHIFAAASLLLASYFVATRVLFVGMDASASVLMLGLAARAAVALVGPRPVGSSTEVRVRWALLLGVLLAGATFARLDNAAFAAVATLWFGWLVPVDRDAGHLRRLRIALVAPQVLLLGLYFVGNWWCFESALPISGLVKQMWSANAVGDEGFARWLRRALALLGHRDVRDGLLFGVAAVLLAWLRCRGMRTGGGDEHHDGSGEWYGGRALLGVLVSLLALAAAKTCYYAATVEPELASYSWYFTVGALTKALALALLADALLGVRWFAGRRRWHLAALWLVAGVAIWQAARGMAKHVALVRRTTPDWEMLSFDAATWLAANAPPEARVGSFDAGVIGYFAPQPVTNLDGLVQSRAFYEARHRGEPIDTYLRAANIEWIANVATDLVDLRSKGIETTFEVVHEGPRVRCIDGVERSLFVLRRR